MSGMKNRVTLRFGISIMVSRPTCFYGTSPHCNLQFLLTE